MSTASPCGTLRPWLASLIETGIEDALCIWKINSSQRTKCTASQALDTLYEDDGSNFRIEVCRSSSDTALVQIVQFTQVEDDEPIDAIVSDSEKSIRARFSKDLRAQLENKRRRSITDNTEGGLIRLRKFEIVIPRYHTSGDEPVHLFLEDAIFESAQGALAYDEPTPIKTLPSIKKLLKRFQPIFTEGESNKSASEDTAEGSDDDVLSQGEPTEASQSQFGSQMPFPQASIRQKTGGRATTGQPTIIKKVPAEQTGLSSHAHPGLHTMISLLKKRQEPRAPISAPIPASTLPEVPLHPIYPHSSSPRTKDENTNRDILRKTPEARRRDVVDQAVRDEDDPGAAGAGEDLSVSSAFGGSNGLAGGRNTSQETSRSVGPKMSKGSSILNNTPTSYQVPAISSSNVSTTDSSYPNERPTGDRSEAAPASQKCNNRLIHHPRWNCVLPATRSACRVPQDQELILNKPSSILPSPNGNRFPVGNVPHHLLAMFSTKADALNQRSRVENGAAEADTSSAAVVDIVESNLSSPAQVDAAVEELSSSPQNGLTRTMSWSLSPVRPIKRLADLPPDSSLSDRQDADENTVLPRSSGTECSQRLVTDVPSSPPHESSQAIGQNDPMDNDSDLEMAVPQAYTNTAAGGSQRSLGHPAGEVGSREDALAQQGLRYAVSTGNNDARLHLLTADQTCQVATNPPGKIGPMTQPAQRLAHGGREISSSAPIVPCSLEFNKTSQHRTHPTPSLDGSAESRLPYVHDQEHDMVERQIQSEQASRSSQLGNQTSPSHRIPNNSASPISKRATSAQLMSPSAASPPQEVQSKGPLIKREARSRSPPQEARKKMKKSHADFHFSQDLPVLQDPLLNLRESRRQFHTNRQSTKDTSAARQAHRSSGSSTPDSARSNHGSSPARSPGTRNTGAPIRIKKEPSEQDRNFVHGLRQPGSPALRRPASSQASPGSSKANAPVKIKTEVPERDEHRPSPSIDVSVISQPASHDAMDIDVPVGEQPQADATEIASTDQQEGIRVEETILANHARSPQGMSGTVVGGAGSSTQSPYDRRTPSLAKEKPPPRTTPQSLTLNDVAPNKADSADAVRPSACVDGKGLAEPKQTEPNTAEPEVAKADDVFTQFSRAYPGYAGNRRHFENLCGQLDWMRSVERGLHPYLWDDYIIRSKTDFKTYTEECADEGIDPLPWYKYYIEAIPVPKFSKGIMNAAMLEKFLAEQGRPLRPVVDHTVPCLEPAARIASSSAFAPFVDDYTRGRDSFYLPRGPRRQRKSKSTKFLQRGLAGTPVQPNTRMTQVPSISRQATDASLVANGSPQINPQPPANTIVHAVPHQPLEPAASHERSPRVHNQEGRRSNPTASTHPQAGAGPGPGTNRLGPPSDAPKAVATVQGPAPTSSSASTSIATANEKRPHCCRRRHCLLTTWPGAPTMFTMFKEKHRKRARSGTGGGSGSSRAGSAV